MMIDLVRARDDANYTETQLDRRHGPLIRLMADEIEGLRTALELASTWGMGSDGYDARTALALKEWVDGGFQGEPPKTLSPTSTDDPGRLVPPHGSGP